MRYLLVLLVLSGCTQNKCDLPAPTKVAPVSLSSIRSECADKIMRMSTEEIQQSADTIAPCGDQSCYYWLFQAMQGACELKALQEKHPNYFK